MLGGGGEKKTKVLMVFRTLGGGGGGKEGVGGLGATLWILYSPPFFHIPHENSNYPFKSLQLTCWSLWIDLLRVLSLCISSSNYSSLPESYQATECVVVYWKILGLPALYRPPIHSEVGVCVGGREDYIDR